MNDITLKAYAKINLGLDVVGLLPNGYHQVSMIMQTIDLYDELEIAKAESGILLSIDNSDLPADSSNLVYKAAALMQEKYSIGGVNINLKKNIPMAAGMAGGSTDCAATLRGINDLYELGLSDETLRELGVTLGADVPYCVIGGTCLSEGIGEVLTTLSPMPDCYILIAKPPVSVSTAYVYRAIDTEGVGHHPDISGMVEALKEQSLTGITERLENVLERVTVKEHKEIADIKNVMLSNGAMNSLMSGSGPTVFGIFDDLESAKKAEAELEGMEIVKDLHLVKPVNRI